MLNGTLFQKSAEPHPVVAIQLMTDQVFRPSSPEEVFSDERPVFVPETPGQEGWIPIDVLLGCYIPAERKIRIFRLNIEQYSRHPFNCSAEDLGFIVRLHEYAHALVHLGVSVQHDRNLLVDYPNAREKRWDDFVGLRNIVFSSIDASMHEFLSQTLTWCSFNGLESHKAEKLKDLFLRLMVRQPLIYRVATEILEKAQSCKWPVLLKWLQDRETLELPEGSTLRQAAESLLVRTVTVE